MVSFFDKVAAQHSRKCNLCLEVTPETILRRMMPDTPQPPANKAPIVWYNGLAKLLEVTCTDIAGLVLPWKALTRTHSKRLPMLTAACTAARDFDGLLILDLEDAPEPYSKLLVLRRFFPRLDAIALMPSPDLLPPRELLSDPNSGLLVHCLSSSFKIPLPNPAINPSKPFARIAGHVREKTWNANHNCGLIASAAYPAKINWIREIAPRIPMFLTDIGRNGVSIQRAAMAATSEAREAAPIFYIAPSGAFTTQDDHLRIVQRMTRRIYCGCRSVV